MYIIYINYKILGIGAESGALPCLRVFSQPALGQCAVKRVLCTLHGLIGGRRESPIASRGLYPRPHQMCFPGSQLRMEIASCGYDWWAIGVPLTFNRIFSNFHAISISYFSSKVKPKISIWRIIFKWAKTLSKRAILGARKPLTNYWRIG